MPSCDVPCRAVLRCIQAAVKKEALESGIEEALRDKEAAMAENAAHQAKCLQHEAEVRGPGARVGGQRVKEAKCLQHEEEVRGPGAGGGGVKGETKHAGNKMLGLHRSCVWFQWLNPLQWGTEPWVAGSTAGWVVVLAQQHTVHSPLCVTVSLRTAKTNPG